MVITSEVEDPEIYGDGVPRNQWNIIRHFRGICG